ncbi:MAG: DMT family transporter [Corynebacterium glyciniphilum]|nr:DMT family transporter [Corynebacterium glyciniphilum]
MLWGTTGTAASLAENVGPLAIGAVSLGVGGLLQALIAAPDLWRTRALLREQRGMVLLGGIAVFTYPLAFYSSMHLAGVAVGTVISLASAPLAAGVIEKMTGGPSLGAWWSSAAGLGITGAVLISAASGGDDTTADNSATLAGIALGLLAGVSYALYAWVAFRLMKRRLLHLIHLSLNARHHKPATTIQATPAYPCRYQQRQGVLDRTMQ